MTRSVPVSAVLSALIASPTNWLYAAWAHPMAMVYMVLGLIALTLENVGVPDVTVFGDSITAKYLVEIGLMICGVGFAMAVAMDWGLRRTGWWPRQMRIVAIAVVTGVAAASLFGMPDAFLARFYPYLFWQVGAVALALYFALRPPRDVPTPDAAQLTGWYGGQRVLLSAATTWVLATILGAGVTVALIALDELLGFHVSSDVYAEVWILAYALVWPMSFLVGAELALPEETHERRPVPETPPRWIAVTVGWALIPLALLYLVILYIYLVQLMLGMATDLVSVAGLNAAYLAFGVATHTAALPLARAGNGLALAYRRVFPWSVPAPLAALIWALSLRLFEYGMTEPRAILTVVVLWLVLLLLVWMARGAAAGPATPVGLLGVLLLLSGNGHWGVQSVSMASQDRALRDLLAEHGMMNESGQAVPAVEPLPEAQAERVVDLLEYFDERASNFRIAYLFPAEQGTADERIVYLDLESVAPRVITSLTLEAEPDRNTVPVSGYDEVVPLSVIFGGNTDPIRVGEYALEVEGLTLTVRPEGGPPQMFGLAPLLDAARAGRSPEDLDATLEGVVSLAPDVMERTATGANGWRARLAVDMLNLRHDGTGAPDGMEVLSLDGLLVVDRPQE
ncbi:DUF4153 domain-containing protein [Rhodospira trueperi]|uniref:DUF4153 domain-containing protein n=1 Tax=Rhodospira trueperi TaxID=69960 RepID=A0A1G6YM30_9PROT|nr:DUF4153 domain-containing protein [Rhodospira trueperi]SDD90705.1 protein of unknown function [Rhodospira trueperi]